MTGSKGLLHRVLVLGATGFIGSHVARAILERGGAVRGLRRWNSATADLADRIDWIVGDIADPDSLGRALAGCSAVVVSLAWKEGPDPDDLRRLRRLMDLLHQAAGTQARVAFVSSALTLAPPDPRTRLADATGIRVPRVADLPIVHGHYHRELEVRRLAGLGLPAVLLNPTLAIGPGAPPERGNSLLAFLRDHRLALSSGGLTNVVDVRDLADGVVRALERGNPGQRYTLAAHNLTLAELGEALDAADGRRTRRLHVPPALAARWRSVRDRLGALATLPFDAHTRALAASPWYFDASPTRDALGWTPRPLADTLRDTLR